MGARPPLPVEAAHVQREQRERRAALSRGPDRSWLSGPPEVVGRRIEPQPDAPHTLGLDGSAQVGRPGGRGVASRQAGTKKELWVRGEQAGGHSDVLSPRPPFCVSSVLPARSCRVVTVRRLLSRLRDHHERFHGKGARCSRAGGASGPRRSGHEISGGTGSRSPRQSGRRFILFSARTGTLADGAEMMLPGAKQGRRDCASELAKLLRSGALSVAALLATCAVV